MKRWSVSWLGALPTAHAKLQVVFARGGAMRSRRFRGTVAMLPGLVLAEMRAPWEVAACGRGRVGTHALACGVKRSTMLGTMQCIGFKPDEGR